jgi:hypothetical protein
MLELSGKANYLAPPSSPVPGVMMLTSGARLGVLASICLFSLGKSDAMRWRSWKIDDNPGIVQQH